MATTSNSTQTGDGNDLVQTLRDARYRKAQGNSFFGEGRHDKAAEEYINALTSLEKCQSNNTPDPEIVSLTVMLRSNLAACYLEKGQYAQAVDETQAVLALDPLHIKSYIRLCKAQHSLRLIPEAAEAMSILVALTLPRRLDDVMQRIFNELVRCMMLPPDISFFACVATDRELRLALLGNYKTIVVLKPGTYTGGLGSLELDSLLTLIGIGKVNIMNGAASGHSLYLICGQMRACRLNLVGRVESAVCIGNESARLSLADSTVEDHKGQGVLVRGGHVTLHRCTFRNLGRQAVEVRGGSAQLRECLIKQCRQGVVVSGGSKLLQISTCRIEDVAREGVLVIGKNRSAFGLEELRSNLPGERAARREAETADRTILKVEISNCVVKGSRKYGLFLDDMDANVSIVDSMLVDNAPAACYVKGGTTVLLDYCQIESGKIMSGLHVGDATITASDNVFVVTDPNSAIVEEMLVDGQPGMLCKPSINRNNKVIVREAGRTFKGGSSNHQALARTCRGVFHNLKNFPVFCGVGNTWGYDLSQGPDDPPGIARILLGACGDIRNFLKTVSSLQSRLHPLGMVQVVMNDWNLAILARNVVLLALIAEGTSAADVVAIWANHALTGSQREDLDRVLEKLTSSSLPDWLVFPESEPGCDLAAKLLEAFYSWRGCTMTLRELDKLHTQSISVDGNLQFDMAVDYVRGAVGHIRSSSPGFDHQIKQHITTGNVTNTSLAMQSANPLLLEAPDLQYTLYWSSSIYRAVKLDVSGSTSGFRSEPGLHELLLQTITSQIMAVADLFKQRALRVAVMDDNILEGMLYGGCLQLLHQLNPSSSTDASPLFDFIDVSNTADILSMPVVVQAALPLLKVEPHSVLFVDTMSWDPIAPRKFVECSLGMDLDAYQELLGVEVRTQVVGPSNKRMLQTQWKWDLRANRETTLTGAMMLFEVMTAAELHCALDRATYMSIDGISLKSERMLAGALAGIEISSSLTLLHLLHLRCPDIALPIVRVLVAANDACKTRTWELMGHALFQQDPVTSQKMFVKVGFQANVQFYTLLACPKAPLCLMVSKASVTVAWAPVDVVTTDVVQLLEAFAYSIESDRVEFMLQQSLLENPDHCKSYFVTVCAVTNGTKLQAVSSSVPWYDLTAEPLTAPLPRWTACEGMAKRALLSDDLELLELMAKMHTSGSDDIPAQSWKTHTVLETSRFVIVELLLPRPLPGPDKVTISVTRSGAALKVAAKAVEDFVFPDQEHTTELPTAISFGWHTTKVNRKLGTMILRLPKVV